MLGFRRGRLRCRRCGMGRHQCPHHLEMFFVSSSSLGFVFIVDSLFVIGLLGLRQGPRLGQLCLHEVLVVIDEIFHLRHHGLGGVMLLHDQVALLPVLAPYCFHLLMLLAADFFNLTLLLPGQIVERLPLRGHLLRRRCGLCRP